MKGHGAKALSIVMAGVLAFGMMPGLAFAAPAQAAGDASLANEDDGLAYEADISKSTTITVNGTEGNSYLGVPLDPITMSDSANENSDWFTKSLSREEGGWFDYVVEYENNTNPGKATYTITGGRDAGASEWATNYTGTLSGTFEIAQGDLANAEVSLVGGKGGVFFGDGATAVTPAIKVSLGTVLEGSIWDLREVPAYLPESDFTAVYRDASGDVVAEPKEPGAYTVEVTAASANVTGTSAAVPFIVTDQAIDLSAATFSHEETDDSYNTEVKDGIEDQTYAPGGVEPAFAVALDDVELVKDVDYTVAFSGNDKVGTATATITGKGLYTGSASATFEIAPADITGKGEPDWSGNGCTVVLGERVGNNSTVPFTGSAHDAPVTVKFGSGYSWDSTGVTGTLVAGVDYDVSYANTTDVWLASNLYSGEDREELYPADKQPTITVTGKGNYTGTATKTFSITPRVDIAKASVNSLPSPTFNGTAQALGLDAAGTAYISFYGDFCAYGLQGGEGVLYDTTYLDADGNAVDASGVVAAGEYTMVVTGKPTGGFTGEKRIKFAIAPADFASVEIGAIPDQIGWNAESAPVPEMTCTFGEGDDAVAYELTADDYSIEYKGDGLKGNGKVKASITPRGNFSGEKRSVIFNVVTEEAARAELEQKLAASDAAAEAAAAAAETANASNEAALSAALAGEGVVASVEQAAVDAQAALDAAEASKEAAEAAKEAAAKIAAGTANESLKVDAQAALAQAEGQIAAADDAIAKARTGKAVADNVRQVAVALAKTDLSDAAVTVAKAVYNGGKAVTPKVTVKLGGKTLVAGDDYKVTYVNNKKVGTAAVVVAGKGSFTGAAVKEFSIGKAANPMTVSGKTVSVKLANVKKKDQAVKMASAFAVKNAQGAVTFAKASGDKRIAVAKNGTVTVKKGTPKGTYKVKVNVTAAGNGNYSSVTKKSVVFTVKVS